uniref:Uncharacterized protein n=1 Tax=Knipowitschia caucasica TaxID=637954 RepID=A0AAV2LTA8_KNICA
MPLLFLLSTPPSSPLLLPSSFSPPLLPLPSNLPEFHTLLMDYKVVFERILTNTAEYQPQSTAEFLPEWDLPPLASFTEDSPEDRSLSPRPEDQVSHNLNPIYTAM